MAETVGSLADKLSIVELKIWHMCEHSQRRDATEEFRAGCQERLCVLRAQRDDLADELTALLAALLAGEAKAKVYRQFKMYNDPQYRRPPSPGPTHTA